MLVPGGVIWHLVYPALLQLNKPRVPSTKQLTPPSRQETTVPAMGWDPPSFQSLTSVRIIHLHILLFWLSCRYPRLFLSASVQASPYVWLPGTTSTLPALSPQSVASCYLARTSCVWRAKSSTSRFETIMERWDRRQGQRQKYRLCSYIVYYSWPYIGVISVWGQLWYKKLFFTRVCRWNRSVWTKFGPNFVFWLVPLRQTNTLWSKVGTSIRGSTVWSGVLQGSTLGRLLFDS